MFKSKFNAHEIFFFAVIIVSVTFSVLTEFNYIYLYNYFYSNEAQTMTTTVATEVKVENISNSVESQMKYIFKLYLYRERKLGLI